jgi:hypothetical protein
MTDVASYIKRAAERTKFTREYFIEQNMPTHPSNVLAIPFYGDISSTFLMSSLILRSYKEVNPDKYIILCSWPGYRGLFPYVDEYWSIDDESVSKSIAVGAEGFYNSSDLATEVSRGLVECLDVKTARDFMKYYDRGLTDAYWGDFKTVRRFLPEVPSETLIADSFRKQIDRKSGRKVIIFPSRRMRTWHKGKSIYLQMPEVFWSGLCEQLLDEGFTPVVWQNWHTYDLSREFTDRCIYLVPRSIVDALAAMRYVGIVLDVFSGVSRMAMAARSPCVVVDERMRYIQAHEYVVDDLCGSGVPRQYIFGFATMLLSGTQKEWKASITDNIIARLNRFIPEIQGRDWGSTNESYREVDYGVVRRRVSKHMGVHFISSSKDK